MDTGLINRGAESQALPFPTPAGKSRVTSRIFRPTEHHQFNFLDEIEVDRRDESSSIETLLPFRKAAIVL
jgi:hypothetical protein